MSSAPMIPAVPYGQPPTGGAAPAVTPPQGSFTQGDQASIGGQPVPGGPQPDQLKQWLAALLAKQSQPQLVAPVPSPIPDQKQQQQVPMNHQWGFERFANQIGGHIQTAVANQKKAQLAKAESDWGQFNAAVQSGKGELWLAQNEKAAKNMAKALNQDWLNPEKTNVYRQALDNYTKQQQAKGQAASGLQSLMKKLIGKAQNPQLTDEQKQAIAKEQMAKAPMAAPPADVKDLLELQKNVSDELYKGQDLKLRQKEADQKDAEIQQNFELKRDDLQQRIEDTKQRALDRQTNEQDRVAQWQVLNDLRGQQIATTKQLADYRMSSAETPKDLRTSWDSTIKDLRDTWMQANKDLGQANNAYIRSAIGLGPNKDVLLDQSSRAKAARVMAESMTSDVVTGKIEKQAAVDKVHSMFDSGTWKPVQKAGKVIGYTSDGKTMIPVGQ